VGVGLDGCLSDKRMVLPRGAGKVGDGGTVLAISLALIWRTASASHPPRIDNEEGEGDPHNPAFKLPREQNQNGLQPGRLGQLVWPI
jgi:hypothetical protein